MEAVHRQKAEKVREKTIADQLEARRVKGKASRERKAARREERIAAVSMLWKHVCMMWDHLGDIVLAGCAHSSQGHVISSQCKEQGHAQWW
eukprot:365998-Chlamydomonas_euryale.AAC.6